MLGVVDAGPTAPLRVHAGMSDGRPSSAGCGTPARVKERPRVDLVDLPVFGGLARLVEDERANGSGAPARRGAVVESPVERHRAKAEFAQPTAAACALAMPGSRR